MQRREPRGTPREGSRPGLSPTLAIPVRVMRGGVARKRNVFAWRVYVRHEAIADRFWRAPTSRAGAGTGLGLPIVRRLVEGAGGTVTLGDSDGQSGLRVTVRLPRDSC